MKDSLFAAKRKKRGMTQGELAEEIGIDSTSISHLERELKRGDTVRCPGHLEAACEVLDIDPDEARRMVEWEVSILER